MSTTFNLECNEQGCRVKDKSNASKGNVNTNKKFNSHWTSCINKYKTDAIVDNNNDGPSTCNKYFYKYSKDEN